MTRNKALRLLFSLMLFWFFLMIVSIATNESTVSWQEEVKLRTGEIITIDREVKHVGGGAAWPQGQGSVPREYLIRFRYPPKTGSLIEWRSTKFNMPRASRAELPLVLDLSTDNTWFIYTMQWVNEDCIRYVKYQFQQGTWAEIPWSEEPIEVYETNLYLGAGSNDLEGLVSLGTKFLLNTSGRFLWFFRKVGPYQVMPDYFDSTDPNQLPPMSNRLHCVWEPTSQTFKMIRINGEKK